jgi:hypothetical protein
MACYGGREDGDSYSNYIREVLCRDLERKGGDEEFCKRHGLHRGCATGRRLRESDQQINSPALPGSTPGTEIAPASITFSIFGPTTYRGARTRMRHPARR